MQKQWKLHVRTGVLLWPVHLPIWSGFYTLKNQKIQKLRGKKSRKVFIFFEICMLELLVCVCTQGRVLWDINGDFLETICWHCYSVGVRSWSLLSLRPEDHPPLFFVVSPRIFSSFSCVWKYMATFWAQSAADSNSFFFFWFLTSGRKKISSLRLVNTSSISSGSHVQVLIFFDSWVHSCDWLFAASLIYFLVGDEGSRCRDLIGMFPNPSLF